MSVKYWYECIIEIQPFSWMLYFKTIKVLLHGFILVYKKKTRPVKISLNKFIFIKMFNTAKCWDWISVTGGPAFIQHSGKQYVGRWSVYSEKRFKMLPVCQPQPAVGLWGDRFCCSSGNSTRSRDRFRFTQPLMLTRGEARGGNMWLATIMNLSSGIFLATH